jgi:SAM-dependent methyltransferase
MTEFFARLLLRLGIDRRPVRSRHDTQQRWQERWSDQNFEAPWMNRGISPEIVEAVASGWFPAGATALDIGCGEGEVAAWMAEHGFPSVGVDIAPAAVARAQASFNEVPGRLEFFVVDVCDGPPPDRQYRVLIDRGCFHTIQSRDYADWLEHLLHVSAPDAKLLLLCRAFRDGIPQGDPHERRRVTASVEQGFGRGFRIVRSADTYLDPFDGRQADKAMGGIVFWMERV